MLSIKTWIKENDKCKVEYWIEISGAMDRGQVLIIETNDENVPQRSFFDRIDETCQGKGQISLTPSNQEKIIKLVEQWAIENNYKEASEDYFSHQDRPK